MSEGQKVIKYCAMAFAIVLSIGIISGIASAAFAVVSVISGGKGWNEKEETVDYSKTFTGVESLEIDHSIGKLDIKVGDGFKVDANNVSKEFRAEVNGNGKLIISDSHKHDQFLWFIFKNSGNLNSKITVYLPADFVASDAKLDAGAGNISIEALNADFLKISAGAGNIDADDLTAEDAQIDGGVGEIRLEHVNFTDADFDCGVGNLDVDGILLGKTKVDSGVGNVDFNLSGNVNDYGFDIDSGIGMIRVNGEKISDKTNEGAANLFKIDGGVGNISIDFAE